MATTKDSPANIVIIGGGIIGVCTAYYLSIHPASSKSKITILEGTEIAAAASGRAGGLLAKWAYPDCLAGLSFTLHQQLAATLNGVERWGYRNITCGEVRANTGTSIARSSKTKKPKLPADLDWLNRQTVVAYDEVANSKDTAQVHPRLFTQAMAEEAQKNGVAIVLGQTTKIDINESTNKVTSVQYNPKEAPDEKQSLLADVVILAAGPWSKTLLPALPLQTERAHSLVLRTPHTVSPHALFTSIATSQGQHAPEIYARPDSTVYTCGATDSLAALPPSAADVQVDAQRCDELLAQVVSLSDLMGCAEVVARQACYLPNVAGGGGPLVGWTRTRGLMLATGHTCWGIQNSAATGKLVSELLFDGKTRSADISELDPANWNI